MTPTRLLVLAGMDGAGKTLQARRLVQELTAADVPTCYLWCRGRNWLSLPIIALGRRLQGAPKTHQDVADENDRRREADYQKKKTGILRNPLARLLWSVTVLTERLLELSLYVRRALRRGQVVVADRYLFDSLVDLAVDLDEPPEVAARRLSQWYTAMLPRPDCVFLLDVDPVTAYARKSDVPSLDYLTRRRAHYLALARAGGWTVIDASQPPGDVFRRLWDALPQNLRCP